MGGPMSGYVESSTVEFKTEQVNPHSLISSISPNFTNRFTMKIWKIYRSRETVCWKI